MGGGNRRGAVIDDLSVVEEDIDTSWKKPVRTGNETNR
jgi:hypothetical protein